MASFGIILPMISSRYQQSGYPMQSWLESATLHNSPLQAPLKPQTAFVVSQDNQSLIPHVVFLIAFKVRLTRERPRSRRRICPGPHNFYARKKHRLRTAIPIRSFTFLILFFVVFLHKTSSLLLCLLPAVFLRQVSKGIPFLFQSLPLGVTVTAAQPFLLSPQFSYRWLPR